MGVDIPTLEEIEFFEESSRFFSYEEVERQTLIQRD